VIYTKKLPNNATPHPCPYITIPPSVPLLRQIKPKTRHTALIFINRARAIFLGIFRITEQHTFVASRFFVFAYTAGLFQISNWLHHQKNELTFTFAAACPAGLRSAPMFPLVAVAVHSSLVIVFLLRGLGGNTHSSSWRSHF
jgi:hypothetical membrane protein